MNENAVIAILAYNEEGAIRTPIEYGMSLKKHGLAREVLVVDDGSTDRTGEVAKNAGAAVMRLEKNSGKGAAFLEAALHCKKSFADIMVLIDADMVAAVNKPVEAMLDLLRAKDGTGSPTLMVVAPSSEGNSKLSHRFSGQRAIRVEALDFLFVKRGADWALSQSKPAERFKEMSAGYGLEAALNHQIRAVAYLPASEAWFKHDSAFRKGRCAQEHDITNTIRMSAERNRKAEALAIERRFNNKSRAVEELARKAMAVQNGWKSAR